MNIKTNYIKNKIKERNFNSGTDRKYIEDLMYIERLLWKHPREWGYAGAMELGFKRNEYPDEYDAIDKELDPKNHEKRIESDKKRKKINDDFSEKMRKQEVKELEEFKKMWLESGGKGWKKLKMMKLK